MQALQSVDEMVTHTIAKLEYLGLLDNTYVIYTSDNGFHIGQHRLGSGKRCPYEEDINVPLIVRGPGIPKGKVSGDVSSHTDITPSILHWAGASSSIELDGTPIKIGPPQGNDTGSREHVAIEYWGNIADGEEADRQHVINTYKATRVIGPGYNLFYSVWCDGSHEVYDMLVSLVLCHALRGLI